MSEELPPDTDFDVVTIGKAIEDHYGCEPREGLANPECRVASKIAVRALREEGKLGPLLDSLKPEQLSGPWHFDISDDNQDVRIVAKALKIAGDTWSEPHIEFAQIAVASLMRNQRLELPVQTS